MLILISLFLCPLTYVLYTCIYAILYYTVQYSKDTTYIMCMHMHNTPIIHKHYIYIYCYFKRIFDRYCK